jgi:integrase
MWVNGTPGRARPFPAGSRTACRPRSPQNLLQRVFHPLLERAGLPRMRFHDLRHTAASLLLGGGIHPKIVSEMLGHAQRAVTLDPYSHVSPTMQRGAVTALDGLFGCQVGPGEGIAAGEPS